MFDLNKRGENAWLMLGLLGTACGPIAAPEGETGSEATGATGPQSSTDPTTTDPTVATSVTDPTYPTTTDPTNSSDPSSPSSPTTLTEPMPECQSDSDCSAQYCGYCLEGLCQAQRSCCGYYDGLTPAHAQGWRCLPPLECYSDSDCGYGYGYACANNFCTPVPTVPLGPCGPREFLTSEWNLSASPEAFVLADLDGDMDLDIAAAEASVAQIEVALNDGAGNFVLAGAFPLGPPDTSLALAAGDLDLDGDIDLAVVRRDGGLVLLFGQDAVFTPTAALPTSVHPTQVFIADVDADGTPDIVTLSDGPPQLTVRKNDGKGGLGPEIPAKSASTVKAFGDLGDLGGDGLPDLVTPVTSGVEVALFTGTIDGIFVETRTFGGHSGTTAAFAADLVPKSFLDVIALRSTDDSGSASVWSGLGENQWSAVPTIFTGSLALQGGVMAELEDPPGPDLVSATGLPSLALWAGDGVGGLMCERVLPLSAATSPALIATGDVDGDGLTDIVAAHAGGTTVSVLRPQ